MKNLARFKYSVNIDVDIMREDMNMTDEQIKAWFNTPCDDETGYNGYLDDVAQGEITLEELNEIIDEILAK